MSVTTEDVQEAVKQLWAAGGATLTAIPLIMGRQTDRAAAPYASFSVKDGEIFGRAGLSYHQRFTLEIRTWSEVGAANAGTIKAAIEAAFTVRTRTVFSLGSGRTLNMLHSLKVPGALEEDEKTAQAQAVKITTDRFEILCQG